MDNNALLFYPSLIMMLTVMSFNFLTSQPLRQNVSAALNSEHPLLAHNRPRNVLITAGYRQTGGLEGDR